MLSFVRYVRCTCGWSCGSKSLIGKFRAVGAQLPLYTCARARAGARVRGCARMYTGAAPTAPTAQCPRIKYLARPSHRTYTARTARAHALSKSIASKSW